VLATIGSVEEQVNDKGYGTLIGWPHRLAGEDARDEQRQPRPGSDPEPRLSLT
jgi:hypothetical protein